MLPHDPKRTFTLHPSPFTLHPSRPEKIPEEGQSSPSLSTSPPLFSKSRRASTDRRRTCMRYHKLSQTSGQWTREKQGTRHHAFSSHHCPLSLLQIRPYGFGDIFFCDRPCHEEKCLDDSTLSVQCSYPSERELYHESLVHKKTTRGQQVA